jgi:hypothetical protein
LFFVFSFTANERTEKENFMTFNKSEGEQLSVAGNFKASKESGPFSKSFIEVFSHHYFDWIIKILFHRLQVPVKK